jgi:hypothetical protein
MKENQKDSSSYTQEGGELLLVHAFNPNSKFNKLILAMEEKGVDPEFNQRQAIDILTNPRDINQRVSLSTSLIKIDGKNTTWGEAGYILSVPRADVISTSTSDAGSLNSNYNKLIQQREENIRGGENITAR